MSAMGLTRRQHECLSFMSERIRESGIAPSFDEMKVNLDLKSKSGVHRIITELENRGFIRRINRHARAIEILRLPDNISPGQRPPVSRRQVTLHRVPGHRSPISDTAAVKVPLVGRMASSTPIEALQNKVADVEVGGGMLGRGAHYALEIVGDYMLNAGIMDGDTIIVQETDKANSGEIIVVLVDNDFACLRRLRRRGEYIALEAANPAYETRLYSADRVAIQGRMVGLIRRY